MSLGGNVNTRRMSKPDMGSIFHKNNQWNILVIENYYVNYQNYQNLMLLNSSDTKIKLMHLFLFTNKVYATAIHFPCFKTLHFMINIWTGKIIINWNHFKWIQGKIHTMFVNKEISACVYFVHSHHETQSTFFKQKCLPPFWTD